MNLGVEHTFKETVTPVVDFNKCDTKGICTHVCQKNIFKLQQMSVEEFSGLNFFSKIRTIFSDNRKSFVINSENCDNCGRCVVNCPEHAIQLIPVPKKRN